VNPSAVPPKRAKRKKGDKRKPRGIDGERFMGVEELARYIGTTPKSIREQVGRGAIPYSKIFGRILFDKVVLREFLESKVVKAIADCKR